MAIVNIPEQNRSINQPEAVTRYLADIGIEYERWEPAHSVPAGAPAEEILAAYAPEIDRLKESGGYVTAEVVDVTPPTPRLGEKLAQVKKEKKHQDDEKGFIFERSGPCYIH